MLMYGILLTIAYILHIIYTEVFAMSKLNNNKKVRMDITIDPELQDKLIEICQKEDRSMSNLITIALKQYIANYKKETK